MPRNPLVLDNQALAEITRIEVERQKNEARARTAPGKRDKPRKNWNLDDLEIQTNDGKRKITAPGNVT